MFDKRFNGWEESYQVMQSPPRQLCAQKPGFCPPRALNDTYMTIGGASNCLSPLLAKARCRKGTQRCFRGTKKGTWEWKLSHSWPLSFENTQLTGVQELLMGSEETAVCATSRSSTNHETVGPAPGPSLLFFFLLPGCEPTDLHAKALFSYLLSGGNSL